jgi:methanethiol S-methyltransferase
MARRITAVAYGAFAYLAFLASFTYTIGFLAERVVPKHVDDGTTGPAWQAVVVDLLLLSLFAVQHSVMARPWFKRAWTRIVPVSAERSTYVLAASAVVALLLWQWRPLQDEVWSVGPDWARAIVWAGCVLGWGIVFYSTFLLGHFDLFGLKQVLARWQARTYEPPGFRQPGLYKLVQHPLMLGFLIAFWSTPDMSQGRLLFAAVASAYIVVAVRFEEHDLRAQLGEEYLRHAEQLPRFVPGLTSLASAPPARTH